MKLSIIVLSYNTKALTVNCFKSIGKVYKDSLGKEIELILSDNASQDQTVEAVENLELGVKLVRNNKNYGFSKGNNQGARKALGRYFLFLNSDTEIKDDGFLRMADYMDKNPKIGVLGGKLLNHDGSIQKSAGNFYNLLNLIFVLFGGERAGFVRKAPKNIQSVDWVSGACMMIRSDLFKKLKFDENFFMYIEDMELCYRAKKMGFHTFFYPDIKLIHKELGSSNRTFAVNNIYKGLLYFYRKHRPHWQYLTVKFMLFSKAIVALVVGTVSNNLYLKKTYGQAIKLAV